MANKRPRCDPAGSYANKIERNTKRFMSRHPNAEIMALTGASSNSVRQWRHKLKIPLWAAEKIGYVERLRPDCFARFGK